MPPDKGNPPNHAFMKETMEKTEKLVFKWFHNNITRVLQRAKENHARDIDAAIVIGKELMKKLDEKVNPPAVVPPREVPVLDEATNFMKPIEPEVLEILYGATEKGGDTRYLHERYKKPPEDRFYFRECSSWDYGWQQKMGRVRPRDVNMGRRRILKETFYRPNNAGPDPPHYAQPTGGQVSICSEYSCNF